MPNPKKESLRVNEFGKQLKADEPSRRRRQRPESNIQADQDVSDWSKEVIRIGDMRVDYAPKPGYQRNLDAKWVIKTSPHFDFEKFNQPMVNRRDPNDKVVWIIDGQHRIALAIDFFDLDMNQGIECVVYEGLSVEQEAVKWLAANRDRRAPKAIANHFSAVVANEKDAVAIDKILADRGLRFGTGHTGEVRSIAASYKLHDKKVLPEVLDIMVKAWGMDGANFEANVMIGLGGLVSRYNHLPQWDAQRMATRLSRKRPAQLAAQARQAKAADPDDHGSLAEFVARKLTQEYNRNLHDTDKRVPPWDTARPPKYWWDKPEVSRKHGESTKKTGGQRRRAA
jgi:hypothetical protein